jgi:hypothetical protein
VGKQAGPKHTGQEVRESAQAKGPYLDVVGATSPYTNVIGPESARYFRLHADPEAAMTRVVSAAGQVVFSCAGLPGYNYVVLTSTNLLDWLPVQTNAAPFIFIDTEASPARYYRAVYLPCPSPTPAASGDAKQTNERRTILGGHSPPGASPTFAAQVCAPE